MEEFLLEIGIDFVGGLLQGYVEMLSEQWKRPEAKPLFDFRPR